jgi:hypothetical protein
MTKTEIKHPATFSKPILDQITAIVLDELTKTKFSVDVLDPFAGTGKIHMLENIHPRVRTTGIEIEAEWAMLGPQCSHCGGAGGGNVRTGMDQTDFDWEDCPDCWGTGCKTIVGNALHLPEQWTNRFHMVVTSPTYGNRMADHHDAKDDSKRMTYKHMLGRDLHPDNSGQMHFGPKYKEFHEKAWAEVTRVIKLPDRAHSFQVKSPEIPRPFIPAGDATLTLGQDYSGGLFVLNVSNFIRSGKEVDVCQWHYDTIIQMGYDLELERDVPTARLRYGQNHAARVTHEKIFVFRRTLNR